MEGGVEPLIYLPFLEGTPDPDPPGPRHILDRTRKSARNRAIKNCFAQGRSFRNRLCYKFQPRKRSDLLDNRSWSGGTNVLAVYHVFSQRPGREGIPHREVQLSVHGSSTEDSGQERGPGS